MTSEGGESNLGLVYRVTPAGVLTVLHSFVRNESGTYPRAAVVEGSDGNFYGTTSYGGESHFGTVFRIASNGDLTALHSFAGGESGESPSGLVPGPGGAFFGAMSRGGLGDGTLFEVTAAGAYRVLHTFSGRDGAYPVAPPVANSDGRFYGTTPEGGERANRGLSDGTLYRLTPSASGIATLHVFSSDTEDVEGGRPYAAPVQGSDGDLYGTTTFISGVGPGSIYRSTTEGEITVLHTFDLAENRGSPATSLVEGPDGQFYGARFPGDNDRGTLYRVSPSGAFDELYVFSGNDDGDFPSTLIRGNDGNLYGTTRQGGALGFGTLFRMTPTGEFSVLHSFGGEDGAFPSGLARLGEQDFLVTAEALGPTGGGAIVRITQTATPTPGPTATPIPSGNGGGSLTSQALATLLLLLGGQFGYRRLAPPARAGCQRV